MEGSGRERVVFQSKLGLGLSEGGIMSAQLNTTYCGRGFGFSQHLPSDLWVLFPSDFLYEV